MTKKHIRSALPLYCAAAVWLIAGLVLPIYKLWAIIVTLAVSVAASILLHKVFPGRDIEVQRRADSGNADVNRQIEDGRAILRRIREANDAIEDAKMSDCMDRMEKAGEAIFDALEKDVSKAHQVRRFMNYYLPTTDKLLTGYRSFTAVSGGENVRSAIESIERSMDMIASAFEKQLDALYKDEALDVETEIEVMETMIQADGHSDKGMPLGGN